MDAAEVRAEIERAKIVALAKFARDWGTTDMAVVVAALRQTIPNSASPADAATRAAAITRAETQGRK